MNVDELLALIRAKQYFVLHAPRQTGKTSALIARRDLLNSGEAGDFRCVDVNVEVGQAARGMRAILSTLAENAQELGDAYPEEIRPDILAAVRVPGTIRGRPRPGAAPGSQSPAGR